MMCSGVFTQTEDSHDSVAVRGTASDVLQQKRRELIDKLIQSRIIQKINTPGTVPRVYVLPAFFALTFDEKTNFINVCYAYAYRLPRGDLQGFDEPMWVYNALTNNKIGEISAKTGFSLD